MSVDSFPYPFAPPSPEFCQNNSAGDDVYFSIFKPCVFTFYSTADKTPINHFECPHFHLGGESFVETIEQRKVFGWPDSSVANGPRCYELAKYPSLRNFTLFDDKDLGSTFPPNADIVSVDCSDDYAEAQHVMEDLPQVLEPLTTAIYVFACVLFLSVLTCIVFCCVCCAKRNKRKGYNTVPLYYDGPAVVARPFEGVERKQDSNYAVV